MPATVSCKRPQFCKGVAFERKSPRDRSFYRYENFKSAKSVVFVVTAHNMSSDAESELAAERKKLY